MAQQNFSAHYAAVPVNGLDLHALGQFFQLCYETTDSSPAPRFFFAPGWLDLMGCQGLEVGGWSLSLPVDRGVVVAAVPRRDQRIRAKLLTEDEVVTLECNQPASSLPSDHWLSTLNRVIHNLRARDVEITGADLLISSNLPPGLSLKNLTALEEALMLTLYSLSGADVYGSTSLAMAGHAWLKNHDTQELTPVSLGLQGVSLVLSDSRVQPGVMVAMTSQRSRECKYGLDMLRLVKPAWRTLDDLSEDALQAGQCCLEDEIIRKRLRHCVSENQRVQPAAEAIRTGDMAALGQLLDESMKSWRENFELSCPEWDTLAALPAHLPGVMGSRVLSGGDFEGCTLHWVDSTATDGFEAAVSEAYEAVFDRTPYISVVQPGAVAQELLMPSLALA
jgi:galactokinase